MNKTVKTVCGVLIACLVFGGGFFAGAVSKSEVLKEVRIGYQHEDDPDRVDYHEIYTDLENPEIIDGFLMIFVNREKTEDVNVDEQNPDLYIQLNNPKASVGLIESQVWFDRNGAIMGQRVGEGKGHLIFYKIDYGDAEYIKKTIGYEES